MQTRRTSRKCSPKAGFTLLEILIAVGIVGLLVAVAVANFDKIFGDRQEDAARIFVNQAAKISLTPYRLDLGSYPSTEQGLAALMKAPAGKEASWRGPYMEDLPLDPWGNAYNYRFPGSKNVNGASGYDIWSYGPDGVDGGTDDIGNWKN